MSSGQRFRARVHVYPRREILDPQGKAIGEALERLGYEDAEDVRAGKGFELTVEAADEKAARDRLAEMADKLLANPITEDYSVELLGGESLGSAEQ